MIYLNGMLVFTICFTPTWAILYAAPEGPPFFSDLVAFLGGMAYATYLAKLTYRISQ